MRPDIYAKLLFHCYYIENDKLAAEVHEILLGDLERLADHIPSCTMTEIGIKYLGLVNSEVEHCRVTALTKSNVSWYHSLFCLLLWREKQDNFGSRQRLYFHLTQASKQGLLPKTRFSFLNDQVLLQSSFGNILLNHSNF